MDGWVILKCMFETEVTIVMGVNWQGIGSSSELKMLYGSRGLRNRQFMSFPPFKAACMQNSVFNFQCDGSRFVKFSLEVW